MLWFLGGYVFVAVAFYSYIAMTAIEDPTSIGVTLANPTRTLGKMAKSRRGNDVRRAA